MFTFHESKHCNYLKISIVIKIKMVGWVCFPVRVGYFSSGLFSKFHF